MIQSFVSISIMLVCYFGYICMAEKFCKNYFEISRKNEILFVIIGFCAGVFIDSMCYFVPNIVLSLLSHILFIGLVLLLYRRNTEKKILVAFILITVTTLVENLCVAFLSCLLLFWQHTVNHIPVPVLGDVEGNLIVSIAIIITVLILYRVSKYFAPVFDGRTGKWYILCAIPLLAITAVVDVANWGASNGILVRSGGNMGIYYDQIFSYAGFCVLTALSMFGAGVFIFGMNRLYLEQEKNNQYRLQITAYQLLEEQYSRLERLRHDMKNHVIALSGLLENKELEKMKEYLKNMEGIADLGTGEEITGNRAVDILLYQKRSMAKEKNITWECDARIPRSCCINAFDLSVLFGNILDNALEACERLQKNEPQCERGTFINIQAGVVKKCFLLEVKNSTDTTDAPERDKPENRFSDKENQKKHGIGLMNVRDVVHKYDGTMNIETENGIFVISILVPLSDAEHDIYRAV